MPLLSSPLHELQPRYDVVIIGSGYGGSIAASLLARAVRADGTRPSVCLLERGKEIPVGRFPTTALAAASEFQIDHRGQQIGHQDALYWLHAGDDISVFHGCGLGGTSLINAGVSLPPDARVWQDPRWPRALIDDLGRGLARGFARAGAMLGARRYPGSPQLKKYAALCRSAEHLGAAEHCYQPPINVNFEGGVNHVGIEQPGCSGCGDCVSGCNSGAKNTLMMNYLPDARNQGAEIYCSVRVQRIERREDGAGWRVYLQPIGCDRERFDGADLCVECSVVVLSAGTVGSTEILLRSRAAGLPCSDRVGESFSGNGDFLGFAYNNDQPSNAIGMGGRAVSSTTPPGPCITGIIDQREGLPLADAHVIEEGVIPGALASLLAGPMALSARFGGLDVSAPGLCARFRELVREWASALPGGAYRGALQHTQTFLVMSHDGASGSLRLAGSGVRTQWTDVGKSQHFATINRRLVAATEALGGTYVPTPTFNKLFGYDLVTVHPLGGCAMAETAASGVTNHKGQVFTGPAGDAVYDSLYVSDGSVIPCSLGINPLLTISAIAERNMRSLVEERGWSLLEGRAPGPARYDGRPDPRAGTRLQFTERMAGHGSTVVLADGAYTRAEADGARSGSTCEFVLTVTTPDIKAMIRDPEHSAGLVGTVSAPALSRAPMTAFAGRFNLFVQDDAVPGLKRMLYRMALRSVEGDEYRFDGFKYMHNDPGADIWADTTTLYYTIRRDRDGAGPLVAQGVLHISEADFARQMTTMTATDPDGSSAPSAVKDFGRLFARNLWELYGVAA